MRISNEQFLLSLSGMPICKYLCLLYCALQDLGYHILQKDLPEVLIFNVAFLRNKKAHVFDTGSFSCKTSRMLNATLNPPPFLSSIILMGLTPHSKKYEDYRANPYAPGHEDVCRGFENYVADETYYPTVASCLEFLEYLGMNTVTLDFLSSVKNGLDNENLKPKVRERLNYYYDRRNIDSMAVFLYLAVTVIIDLPNTMNSKSKTGKTRAPRNTSKKLNTAKADSFDLIIEVEGTHTKETLTDNEIEDRDENRKICAEQPVSDTEKEDKTGTTLPEDDTAAGSLSVPDMPF